LPKLYAVVQLAIGIVFLFSSEEKVRGHKSFIEGLAAYRIVPASWSGLTGILVIGFESFLAVAHVTGYLLRVGLLIGLALILCFAVAVSVNLKRGRALPCYCFGGSGSIISSATLARLAMLASGETFLLRMYQPIYPLQLAPVQLGFALFWSALLLISGLWLFAIGDVVRLLKFVR
jgi:hypothetical protein